MMIAMLYMCVCFGWLGTNGQWWCCNWQHGGDVNAADHTGQTALHWSSVRGAVQVAELLLQEGARVNAADMYGYQVCFCLYVLSNHCFTCTSLCFFCC